MVDYGLMNVLRLSNPLSTEEGIRLDVFTFGIMILDMLNLTKGITELIINLHNVLIVDINNLHARS
jgi:hypothetical protein